ncbi:hypothetical protein [Shimia thalassica]|uniref:hypothetical protein n=1 Tax=Shimia thalassica TaxID=1715693 RepID=UPI00273317FE|nr:hypothetical protein [Shimia thalassica]MDP2518831.1 hypothetical protein [Shimia thalassica]
MNTQAGQWVRRPDSAQCPKCGSVCVTRSLVFKCLDCGNCEGDYSDSETSPEDARRENEDRERRWNIQPDDPYPQFTG